ncbi:MAG TPA: hypothetical protein VMO17_10220 [Terriglobia bacterium]|nr:hypothetical protein [Terriglobia bacterium]
MKRTIITVLATLAFAAVTMHVLGYKVQPVSEAVAIAAPVPAVPMPHACPNIHGAIDGLHSAQQELKDANHDFCGHRQAAMEAIHNAVMQLKQAETCQKCQ